MVAASATIPKTIIPVAARMAQCLQAGCQRRGNLSAAAAVSPLPQVRCRKCSLCKQIVLDADPRSPTALSGIHACRSSQCSCQDHTCRLSLRCWRYARTPHQVHQSASALFPGGADRRGSAVGSGWTAQVTSTAPGEQPSPCSNSALCFSGPGGLRWRAAIAPCRRPNGRSLPCCGRKSNQEGKTCTL